MAWDDEVKTSRVESALAQSRTVHQARQLKEPIKPKPTAGPAAALVLVGVATGHVLWKRHSEAVKRVQWRNLPLVRMFDELIFGHSATRLGPTKKAASHKKTSSSSSSGRQSAAKAAAAAAQARAAASQAPTQSTSRVAAPASAQQTVAPAKTQAAASKRKVGALPLTVLSMHACACMCACMCLHGISIQCPRYALTAFRLIELCLLKCVQKTSKKKH